MKYCHISVCYILKTNRNIRKSDEREREKKLLNLKITKNNRGSVIYVALKFV